MNFIAGSDRSQAHWLPPTVEEYVGADNPVRFLDAFVAKLNLRDLGFLFPKDHPQSLGRPAYPPAELLKLFLYGYLHQIRSSRRLEAECQRNLEVIWLLRELKPDFKTIADFRKNNADAFKRVVREFTRLCRQLDLFGGQLLAIDGSKFKASNAPHRNWTQPLLEKQQAQIEARLEEYLKALAEADASPAAAPARRLSAAELQEKIARLHARKGKIQQRSEALAQSGQTQRSASDPDSRCMKGRKGIVIGYNVQASVDAKNHLLVTTDVTNTAADQGQLAAVAKAAQTELAIKNAAVAADSGYYKAADIKACQDAGLEAHVSAPNNSASERADLFSKNDFTYEAARDLYRCPAGAELKRSYQTVDKGRVMTIYKHRKACGECALKARCTAGPYRDLRRWEHEESLERMDRAKASAPEVLARRGSLIEHCWGTLKALLSGGFLVRGLARVGAEVSLAHFAYNFKRALAVVGMTRALEAMGTFRAGIYKMARGTALKPA
jgi:transposase